MTAPAAAKTKDEKTFNILTDLASPAECAKRMKDAAADMPALAELIAMVATRRMKDAENNELDLDDNAATSAQAALLFHLTTEIKPILSIETGFSDGLAAGVITAAHFLNGLNGGHIPIQDTMATTFAGVGVHTLERLGLTGYQIMEHEPALVLPQIYLQKLNNGLKLVYFNSADHVEEQMMEYFYINHLLNEGGVMAINTASPARVDLVNFIRKNRHDYTVREMECGITLVQKPSSTDMEHYAGGTKH